jgi:hypothetical protein
MIDFTMPLCLVRIAPTEFIKSYQTILNQKSNFIMRMTRIAQKINLNHDKNSSINVLKIKVTAPQQHQIPMKEKQRGLKSPSASRAPRLNEDFVERIPSMHPERSMGVALVIHGLNLKPGRMDSIITL